MARMGNQGICIQNFDGETYCKMTTWKTENEMGGWNEDGSQGNIL